MARRAVLVALLVLLPVAGLWAAAMYWRPALAADRYGVVDGDTLELQPQHCLLAELGIGCFEQRLRLYGVDAFESLQTCRDAQGEIWPCGKVATERLRELVAHPDFSCHVDREFVDRHAREFAICTTGGRDVGELLVREGLAFAYGRGAHYLEFEAEAREARRGAWAGRFERPQFFRLGAAEQ
jgi:endonuclease YncB( thermonuclease family)